MNQAKVTNAATGLAGKVAGLQVNLINNGVKAETKITLRGSRSILGNNAALLVVDEVQLPISYLATINPNDIDNVNVLKGGAASALYGSDASNGVIIVTTKKGVKGKPVIKLSSTASFETIGYTPDFQNEFGPWGGEPANFPGMIIFPDQPLMIYAPYENQNYGPRYNGQKVPIGAPIRVFRNDGSYFIAQDSTIYSAKANAKKAFFDKGLTFQNDVSYSGGDDKSKFFFSFQDANIKGVIPKDVARRDAIRANGSREGGIFRVDYNVGYSFTHSNITAPSGVPFNSTAGARGGYTGGGSYFQNRDLYWIVIQQPANVDLRDYRNWRQNPYASPDGYFNAYYGNPWWQIDQSRLDERNNDLIANFIISVKPTSWMDLTYKAGVVRNDYSNKYTKAGYNFAAWAIADTLASGNIPSGVKVLSPSEGDALAWSQRLTSDLLATFHKAHKSFDFKFIAGTSMADIRSRIISTSASVLVIPDFYNISNRVGEPSVTESFSQQRKVGVFGDLTVGYKNWLFLHGSARNDWSSVLAPQNRSYFYP
ncbi:MAG TPA: TonB-dependent receptor plug domain-containing protein, partial [Ferruginibacter sp.]|nr:TonB-dependent receptor plug domain-containing protein [Ferruginibacter sp.]